MFYSEHYTPPLCDYNKNGNLSLEGILKAFEYVGNHHAEKANDLMAKDGFAWILTEWRVEILRRPVFGEKLIATTWVTVGAVSFISDRLITLEDTEGNLLVKASGVFVYVDMKANKMVKIEKELIDAYGPEDKQIFDGKLPRLTIKGEPKAQDIPIILRRSDSDYNRHIHNTRYLAFITDILPQSVYDRDDFHSIRILYKKAVRDTDTAVIRNYENTERFLYGIYKDKELCTVIELK